jgi:predicted MFS family arabinose efflux permease
MGFIALFAALLSFPALLSGSSVLARPRKARKLFDNTALHDRLFLIFTCCTFFTFLGYIVPYFYIPTYAREVLGTSDSLALYMLVMSVAASFFGRLGSGLAAHYMGSIVTWMLCAFGSGILSLCWISIKTEGTFIAFSVLWGMCASFLSFFFNSISLYILIQYTRRFPLRRLSDTSLSGLRIYISRPVEIRD